MLKTGKVRKNERERVWEKDNLKKQILRNRDRARKKERELEKESLREREREKKNDFMPENKVWILGKKMA